MPDPTSQSPASGAARTPHAEPPGSHPSSRPRPPSPSRGAPAARPADAPGTPGPGGVPGEGDGPSAEERERGRLVGLAVIGAAALVAIVVTIGIFLPAIGAVLSGAPAPGDVSPLPATISVCPRDYAPAGDPLSLAAVRAADGRDPVVVGASSSGCPTGVCVTDGRCLSVFYVRTTEDTYAPYRVPDAGS